MPRLYAAAFPKLDASWISDFRDEHDPLASLIEPHVTLVFPSDQLSEKIFSQAIQAAVSRSPSFQAIFRSAILMPEDDRAYIFLVPDEGFSRIVKLHDQLYAGQLAPSLRLDIPFVPHITIGSRLGLKSAKTLVDRLNAEPFEIHTTIDHVQIAAIDDPGGARKLLDRFPLG
jgi:2'-5' RNA ligase